jgi:regulator of protease activity HflC (stomatin/prohibitin superfamily)
MATYFVILLAVVLAGMLIGLPFFLKWLAEGNILFTTVPEGTAKAVLKSKTLDHIVLSLKGSHLNKPGSLWYDPALPDWEVVKNVRGSKITYEDRNFLSRWLGIYYVGIPPFRTVYEYLFEWNEMRLGNDGSKEVWARKERTDFIYAVAFPYIFIVDEAETKDRLPVDVEIQATVRVVNPYKALFDTENWMEVVSGTLIAAARNFIGSEDYGDLVSEIRKTKSGDQDSCQLCTSVLKLNDALENGTPGIHARYGVMIDMVDILRVDIAGARKAEILDATVQKYTADQKAYTTATLGKAEAEATLAKGTAEAEVISKKGAAEASAIEKKGLAEAKALTARLASWNSGGTLNALIAQMEAMGSQGPGKTVIWANNPFVQRFSGLAEALDTLGIKSVDDLKDYFGKAGDESEEKQA